MLTRLLASTAVAALIASGAAYAQTTESEDTQVLEQQENESGLAGQEIVVQEGQTIILDSADVELTLRLQSSESVVPGDTVASGEATTGMEASEETAMQDEAATGESEEMAEAAPEASEDASASSATGDRLTQDMGGQEIMASDGDILVIQSASRNFQLNFEVRDEQATAAMDIEDSSENLSAMENPESGDDMATGQTAATDMDTEVETDDTVTSAIDRDGMQARTLDQIRADDLIGSTIYGANDESIGSVGDVLLTQDGAVDAVLVDVGGFLGIGTREVAIGIDDVQFMVDDNESWYVYTPFTEEQLEAHPAYDADTYAEQRDQQRLVVR